MSKKKRMISFVIAGVLILAVIVVLMLEFVILPRRSRIALPTLLGLATSAKQYDPDTLSPGVNKAIQKHLVTSIIVGGVQVDGLFSSAYETSTRRGQVGTKTALFLASDQVNYARALVKMNNRSAFFKWIETFNHAFRESEGSFHASALKRDTDALTHDTLNQPTDETQEIAKTGVTPVGTISPTETGALNIDDKDDVIEAYTPVDQHWSVTLSYTRALLEAYQKFGGRHLERQIIAESALLLPLFRDKKTDSELLAGPRMLLALDEWDDPIPGSTPVPGQEAPIEKSMGTYLSNIDLWTMSALARFEPSWAPIAGNWQKIIENAQLESELPLYASAFNSRSDSYIAVTGGRAWSSMRQQLTIVLHLAEIGSINRDFISYIRSELRDAKRLPAGLNPVSGSPTGQSAQSLDYAQALILGRVVDDIVLIESAREVMMQQYAGSQTSDIFGGWYRAGSTSFTFRLIAEDNIGVLLALR